MIKTKTILLITISFLILGCKNNSAKTNTPAKQEVNQIWQETEDLQKKLDRELRLVKDFDQGIKQAQIENKPILLIFTGYAVVNSRRLESELIIGNEKIFSLMKDKYINVWLYVDSKKNDAGKKWLELQATMSSSNYLPNIFILDSKGNQLDGDLIYTDCKTELLPLLEKYVK